MLFALSAMEQCDKGLEKTAPCFSLIREDRLTLHPWLPRYTFN